MTRRRRTRSDTPHYPIVDIGNSIKARVRGYTIMTVTVFSADRAASPPTRQVRYCSAVPARVTVELLADRPDLLVPLARIRWREWHDHPGREDLRWWIDTTRRETGRGGLPVTFVAADAADEAAGGVGLVAVEHPELADRGPWVVGTIVHPQRRGLGIGTALMAGLRQWAAGAGFDQLWVATGRPAVEFYRRCGFDIVGVVPLPGGDRPTILNAPSGGSTPAPR